jgi:hypothetical protein
MKLQSIYTFGFASLISSALALTDENRLAAYHRLLDPWTKGPISSELLMASLTSEFLTEDCTMKNGQLPETKGMDALIAAQGDLDANPGLSLTHDVKYEFVDPDGVGRVFLDLYYVGWNADKSDICHYKGPVMNTFTVAEDGRVSSVVSHWNSVPLFSCMMSTADTKDEL